MKLWIFLLFAVLSTCHAQNEDSLGALPEGWDDYDDQWYDNDFENLYKDVSGENEDGAPLDTVNNEAPLDEEIKEEPLNNVNIDLPLDQSVQNKEVDMPLEENDRRVEADILKFLENNKDEMPFKDYQFEDNRSGNQEEKSLDHILSENADFESDSEFSSVEKDDDDDKNEKTMIESNYSNDKEEFEDKKSIQINSNELNDALINLNDQELLKVVQETQQILAQADEQLNEKSNVNLQKTESSDEQDIPSAPNAPTIDEELFLETNKILQETVDALDQSAQNEPKQALDQSGIKIEKKLEITNDEDTEIKINEVDLKEVRQDPKGLDEDEEFKINKEDLESFIEDNKGLDEDLKSLFKEFDDIASESDNDDDNILEVDFDQLFDESNDNEKNKAVFQLTNTDIELTDNEKSNEENNKSSEKLLTAPKQKETDNDADEKKTPTQSENEDKQSETKDNNDLETPAEDQNKNDSKVKSVKVEELTSSEFQDILQQFSEIHSEDLDVNSKTFAKDVAPIHIELTAADIVTVTSPGYPDPYPDNNIIDWIFEGKGTGIELNITDFDVNGALGDYLLIKPGGLEDSRANGILVTHHLTKERRYRFTNVDRMFVRFEAKQGMTFKKGFSFDVRMIFAPEEELDTATEAPLLPTPLHTLTVNLGGLSLPQFLQIQENFRLLVADMATLYINNYDIGAQNTTSSVTQLVATSLCNLNWPNAENCVEVRFAVPVLQTAEESRLNEEDLNDMWYTFVYQDPFAARLRQMGVSSFFVPKTSAILSVWLVIGVGVLVSMSMLAFVLWRYSCVEDYTRMHNASDAGSVGSKKRPLELYPTPHQTLPPLCSDQYKYAYEDTATVDMDGFRNQGYAQDDLFDIDSDDEVNKRERNQSNNGVSARDIYKI